MAHLLFDTNIAIYVFGEHPTYMNFLRTIIGKKVGMSVMTYMEMLIGARDERDNKAMEIFFSHFEIFPVDVSIAHKSTLVFRQRKLRSMRHPWFADTVIGQTALALNVPLVTNNPKDFASFKGLEIIVPENPVRPPLPPSDFVWAS